MQIKNYATSPAAKLTDKIICSDGVTGKTKNITTLDILNLDASSGVEVYYNAIITQTSTNAPIVTTLGLNPMGALTWSYIGNGAYQAVGASAFTGIPVLIVGSNGSGDRFIEVTLLKIDNNTIRIATTLASVSAGTLIATATNGLLTNTWIKIINVI
jgi:hypothetical protein